MQRNLTRDQLRSLRAARVPSVLPEPLVLLFVPSLLSDESEELLRIVFVEPERSVALLRVVFELLPELFMLPERVESVEPIAPELFVPVPLVPPVPMVPLELFETLGPVVPGVPVPVVSVRLVLPVVPAVLLVPRRLVVLLSGPERPSTWPVLLAPPLPDEEPDGWATATPPHASAMAVARASLLN